MKREGSIKILICVIIAAILISGGVLLYNQLKINSAEQRENGKTADSLNVDEDGAISGGQITEENKNVSDNETKTTSSAGGRPGGAGGGGGGAGAGGGTLLTDLTICTNAQNGGLCDGLNIAYGEGYEAACCSERSLCC